MKGRVERQAKPRAPARGRLEMGSSKESCKDGFDVRHGQRQETETATRIGEKASEKRSSAQKQGCRSARCL